jgi:hypothetical protein
MQGNIPNLNTAAVEAVCWRCSEEQVWHGNENIEEKRQHRPPVAVQCASLQARTAFARKSLSVKINGFVTSDWKGKNGELSAPESEAVCPEQTKMREPESCIQIRVTGSPFRSSLLHQPCSCRKELLSR